ncbi:MAG: hypothetical protein U0T81_04105 [Saprospiraceae bacterium]
MKKYIEGGRTFDEIYRKASRLLRENESENNAQKPGKATRAICPKKNSSGLNAGPGTGATEPMLMEHWATPGAIQNLPKSQS